MTSYDDLDLRASLGLAAEPASAAAARRFIRDFCIAADLPDDVCQKAALLVSELVTNAIIHGRTRATLTAERPGGCLRVSVQDSNPHLPDPANPTADSESGRGMRIVMTVADRWGVDTSIDGKAVWFELDL